jgi:hypothetical protein
MTKWTKVERGDFLFVGSVLTRATHPELIVHQRAPRHHTCGELSVTVGTNLTPVLARFERRLRMSTAPYTSLYIQGGGMYLKPNTLNSSCCIHTPLYHDEYTRGLVWFQFNAIG